MEAQNEPQLVSEETMADQLDKNLTPETDQDVVTRASEPNFASEEAKLDFLVRRATSASLISPIEINKDYFETNI